MNFLTLLGVVLFALQCNAKCKPVARGVDKEGIRIIVNKHNELRSRIANWEERKLPPAADMLEMVWDDAVAEKAQAWAEKCVFEHDKKEDRDTGRGYTGQNLYMRNTTKPNPDWSRMVQKWYDEVAEFDRSYLNQYNSKAKAGHFTQVIWAKSHKVGCGFVTYEENGRYIHLYGCNYLPGGNMKGRPIYETGEPCSKCGGCGSIPGLCVGQ